MAGYVMVTIHEIHDAGKLQRYREAAIPSLRKYGGTAVVRPGNRQQFVEGEDDEGVVLIRFPSYEQAVDWYNSPEYRKVMALRMGAVDIQFAIAEGAPE